MDHSIRENILPGIAPVPVGNKSSSKPKHIVRYEKVPVILVLLCFVIPPACRMCLGTELAC